MDQKIPILCSDGKLLNIEKSMLFDNSTYLQKELVNFEEDTVFKLEEFDSKILAIIFQTMKNPDVQKIESIGFIKILKVCHFLKFDLISKLKQNHRIKKIEPNDMKNRIQSIITTPVKEPSTTLSYIKKQKFDCPFRNEENCKFEPTYESKTFRSHLVYIHYYDKFTEKVESFGKFQGLRSGYICKICPKKTEIRRKDKETAKRAVIDHLIKHHDQLRKFLEKDRLFKSNIVQSIHDDLAKKKSVTPKETSTPKCMHSVKKNATKLKGLHINYKNSHKRRRSDFSDTEEGFPENDEALANSQKKAKLKTLLPRVVLKKAEYIRKGPKINLTFGDLNPDSDDESWDENCSEISLKSEMKRKMPRRRASKKVKWDTFSSEEN